MPPYSTVNGGQHDTKYVTFEHLLHAAFVADTIWGVSVKPACSAVSNEERVVTNFPDSVFLLLVSS